MFRDPLFIVAAVACLAVLAVLLFGIGSFGIGGDFNRRNANRLMRWRIGAQAVAIALIVLFVWLRGK
ncbi:twin transmembrane helix small protein [Paenirhodobacter sp.]|uniref:twin transmembrane helix small protein n=1 Tax=Paenirhodobacter sp. TaxID=1965326 RepID=UPI003B3D584D